MNEALDRYITGNYGEDQFKSVVCNEPMRTGICLMDPDHRGRHSTVVFYCDVCGKIRRGQPHVVARQRISHFETEPVADVCFMCAVVDVERREP